jgi:hypothetical protein
VHQFILDVNYMLRVLDLFITDTTAALANTLCERVLKTFFAQLGREGVAPPPMREDEWYEARVDAYMPKVEVLYIYFMHEEEEKVEGAHASPTTGGKK